MSSLSFEPIYNVLFPTLPFPLNYVPIFFRVCAVLLAVPFLLFMALDLIAYTIARTLHISMSPLRVPRSPPAVPHELEDENSDNPIVMGLDIPTAPPTPAGGKMRSDYFGKQSPPQTASVAQHQREATGAGILIRMAVVMMVVGVFLQLFSGLNRHQSIVLAGQTKSPVALVLTAHPDDEVMFFSPTILNLVRTGWGVLGLCLSTGNADGLGSIRAKELLASYVRLGLPEANVTVLDHPALQDTMKTKWDPEVIAEIVASYLAKHDVTHLITFDDQGVTKHPNHVPLAEVHALLPTPENGTRPRLLTLETPLVATKFTGPFWALAAATRQWVVGPAPNLTTFVASPRQYLRALRAMLQHKSQMVWFRWLYAAFSHLMWVNRLIEA